jgi:hypothetical protein
VPQGPNFSTPPISSLNVPGFLWRTFAFKQPCQHKKSRLKFLMPEESPSQPRIILPHLSRWRSLKQFLPTILWFIVGAVLERIEAMVLDPYWLNHGAFSILRWIYSVAGNTAAYNWTPCVIFLVDWLIAVLAGVIGGLVIKRHILRNLSSLALGLALPPLFFYAYDHFAMPSLKYVTDSGFSLLLTICTGLLTHYLKIRLSEKSSPTTS